MARVAALIASTTVLTAEAISSSDVHRGKNFLANMLQPDVAAKSLVAMEEEWQAEAGIYADCQAHGTQEATKECVEASKHFKDSCNKVVEAVLQGSSGDKDSVNQYMDEVCAQDVMQDWHKDRCLSFANQVNGVMSVDSFENRDVLKATDFCSRMWEGIVSSEKERAQKDADEEAERAQGEAKLAEEKLAEEKAEEQKKHEAEVEALKAKANAAKKAQVDVKAKVEEVKETEKKAPPAAAAAAPAVLASNASVQVPVQAPVPVVPANNSNSTKK